MTFQRERSPMERFWYTVAMVVGIFTLMGIIGTTVDITYHVPENAVVYADQANGIYYAPPYIDNNRYPGSLDVSSLKAMSVAECRQLNIKPDPVCVEQGYFKEYDTVTHIVKAKAGLAEPKQSRWNSDGSWNF
ncbi:MAG TPA: hypothetical protein P5309_07750 [Syntrophomonadaceae bacterium]|nr:hypothetical protein [Syntrophomonadaceae bacterium]